MFSYYIKITLRNIKRHLGFSIINISGLALGFACVILIMLWVEDELSYDRFHANADTIGRIIMDIDGTQIPASPGPLAPLMIDEFPEIENATRFVWGSGILEYKEKKFEERDILLVEPSFLNIFSFRFIKGNPETALNNPGSIILTESTAAKYFGDKDPLGKLINYYSQVDRPLYVTGIIEDIPNNSSLKFNALAPFELCKNWKEPGSWTTSQDYQTYVLVNSKSSLNEANHSLTNFCEEYFSEYNIKMFIQPLTEVHLYSHFKFDVGHGDIFYVRVFIFTALVVLLIACINFMNLATASLKKRSKEVGLHKVLGAGKFNLITQSLIESLSYSVIAILLALVTVEILLPAFTNLAGKNMSINYFDTHFLIFISSLVLLAGLVSGSYPAFILSSCKPVSLIKNTIMDGKRGIIFRRALVIAQFSIAIVVISGTFYIADQISFMINKDLGFQKKNLVYLKSRSGFSYKYNTLKQELLKNKNINNMSVSNDIPTYVNLNVNADWEGKSNNFKYIGFQTIIVDEDFLDTYGMQLVKGRFYSQKYPSDKTNAFVLNETAIKTMKIDSPIGKRFSAFGKNGIIIGVIKDFHFKSLKENIEPLILHLGDEDNNYEYLTVNITSGNTYKTVSFIRETWEKYFPDHPYEIYFMDDTINNLYASEQRMKNIFIYFAFLTIFISCLGLFGLVTIVLEQRIKEIGIRKVLGASVSGLVFYILKEFAKWIIIANLIAMPVAYYVINQWLQNFAYRIDISVWPFLFAGIMALVIAAFTISWQAIRAANANPVDSIRQE